jgi:hypothetical protein
VQPFVTIASTTRTSMTEQPGDEPTDPIPPAEGAGEPAAPPAPPVAAPTPPPVPPAAPAASAGGQQYDLGQAKATLQGASKLDLGIIGAGVVAFIASMLPFYTVSVSAGSLGGVSGSVSAWHGFLGWFAVLVALAAAAVVALTLFGVGRLPMPAHQIAAAGFVLALLCLVLALFVDPGGGCGGAGAFGITCDIGRGFGYWLALLAVVAGTALSVMRVREATGTAPAA